MADSDASGSDPDEFDLSADLTRGFDEPGETPAALAPTPVATGPGGNQVDSYVSGSASFKGIMESSRGVGIDAHLAGVAVAAGLAGGVHQVAHADSLVERPRWRRRAVGLDDLSFGHACSFQPDARRAISSSCLGDPPPMPIAPTNSPSSKIG